MSVKKIFITLITVVACVMLGAFVLNVLMPNVITIGTDAVEDQLQRATGITMDFNGNGETGSRDGDTYSGGNAAGSTEGVGNGSNVDGFE